jgi:hypothetical protein
MDVWYNIDKDEEYQQNLVHLHDVSINIDDPIEKKKQSLLGIIRSIIHR